MINNDYLIDDVPSNSGGYCDFLIIKDCRQYGFKSFVSKKKAEIAFINQKKLAKYDLAPKTISTLCKIPYYYDIDLLKTWTPDTTVTGWGFITEKASMVDYDNDKKPYLHKIQKLVDEIWQRTKLKFWDCHEYNIGYVKRGRTKKLVCIDTGKESFDPHTNAWGFAEPGPKCCYCNRYQCKCLED